MYPCDANSLWPKFFTCMISVIQVLNLYANDGERLFQGGTWAAQVAHGPIIIIVGMAYAISLFGVWALIGFAILLLMIPLQVRTLKAIGDN